MPDYLGISAVAGSDAQIIVHSFEQAIPLAERILEDRAPSHANIERLNHNRVILLDIPGKRRHLILYHLMNFHWTRQSRVPEQEYLRLTR